MRVCRNIGLSRRILVAGLVLASAVYGDAQESAIRQWNDTALEAIRAARFSGPEAARVFAIVDTCMYEAWAAYDEHAVGTQLRGALRRPAAERTGSAKQQAVSYAAYRALSDMLPSKEPIFISLMKKFGYDPTQNTTDIETPAGIGNVACATVLEYRHNDKSNQLGERAQGPYSDWSNYRPVNSPGTVPARAWFTKPLNPEHWQPLTFNDPSGSMVVQMFENAHWGQVTPFALPVDGGIEDIVAAPYGHGSTEFEQQLEELVSISSALTDEQKVIAEYWSPANDEARITARWEEFGQFVSERDHHGLDDDGKMFFVLSNSMLDASIAIWDTKRKYDAVRPVTAIPLQFRGKTIRGWGGPGKGVIEMDGSHWVPYQPATAPTPPSPEYVSEEGAFSAAAALALSRWTGSDQFGGSASFAPGSSVIEPERVPAHPIALHWETFEDAAAQAGLAGLYGGVHLRGAVKAGAVLGHEVGSQAWNKAVKYFSGEVVSTFPSL